MENPSPRLFLYGTTCDQVPVGYCRKHKAYLTRRQLHRKQCLTKQCRALEPNYTHPLWAEREEKRENKKRRKRQSSLCDALDKAEAWCQSDAGSLFVVGFELTACLLMLLMISACVG